MKKSDDKIVDICPVYCLSTHARNYFQRYKQKSFIAFDLNHFYIWFYNFDHIALQSTGSESDNPGQESISVKHGADFSVLMSLISVTINGLSAPLSREWCVRGVWGLLVISRNNHGLSNTMGRGHLDRKKECENSDTLLTPPPPLFEFSPSFFFSKWPLPYEGCTATKSLQNSQWLKGGPYFLVFREIIIILILKSLKLDLNQIFSNVEVIWLLKIFLAFSLLSPCDMRVLGVGR